MGSSRVKETKKVDPSTFYGLEAEWGPVSRWTQVLWVLERLRHQAALIGSLAILAALKLAGVSAADTLILSIAIVCIKIIWIVAIILEWISRKKHGHSGEREAAPKYASED